MEFWIPQRPPTTNVSYKISRGRMYLSKEAKGWKEQAVLILRCKHNENPHLWKEKYLATSLTFFDKSILTYDLDGPIRITLNALSAALDFDDRYIMELCAKKRKGPSGVFIHLRELTEREIEEVETK